MWKREYDLGCFFSKKLQTTSSKKIAKGEKYFGMNIDNRYI